MAVTGKSSAARTTRWDVLVSNQPSFPDIPYIADDLEKLKELLAHARSLEARQEDLRSQARQASAELKQTLREGEKLRSRLGANLRGKLGFSDPELAKCGFRPRSTAVRRRKKTGTPEGSTVPTPDPKA
jgi:hypothetical protein